MKKGILVLAVSVGILSNAIAQSLNVPASLPDVYVLLPANPIDIEVPVFSISPSDPGNDVGLLAALGPANLFLGVTTYQQTNPSANFCNEAASFTRLAYQLENDPLVGVCLGANILNGIETCGTVNDPIESYGIVEGTEPFFIFDRGNFGVGTHTLSLHYALMWEWTFSVFCTPVNNSLGRIPRNLIVVSSLTFSGTPTYCEGDASQNLAGFVNVPGGTFTGTGVSGNSFDPIAAGPGTHDITYTVSFANTPQVATTTQVVHQITVSGNTANAGSNLTVCEDDAAFVLTGGSPAGGLWTGTGVSGGGIFTPSSAAIGNNIVTYTVGTCGFQDSRNITVNATPNTNAGTNVLVCTPRTGESAVSASVSAGSSPANGVWSCSNCVGFTLNTNGTFSSDVPAGLYDIEYSVTTSGCTNIDSKTLSVVHPPVIIMPADPTVCTGGDVQLDPIVTGSGLTYSWSPTTGLSDPFRRNPTVSNVTTTRVYTLTTTNPSGCTEFGSITVIHDPGTAVDAGPNNTGMCENDAAFNIVGMSPAGGSWSGNGVSGGVFNPAGVATGIDHTLTYTFTNGNGCVTSDTRIFRVNADPTVEAGIDEDICFALSGSTTINTGSSPAGGVWSCPTCPSGTITNTASGTVRLNTVPGIYEFRYTYTTANGCSDFDTKDVIWTDAPIAVAIADQSLCNFGESVDLDVNVTGGSGGLSYSWAPTASLDDPFNSRPSATPTLANTVYTVTVTDAAGCSTTDNVTVTVTGGVTAEAGTNFSVCADQAIFNLTGGTPAGGDWSGPGVVSNQFFDPAGVPAGLTYELTYSYTDGNGCFDSDTRFVTVNDVPVVDISGSFDVCSNDAPLSLSGGSPAGGVWTGTGVSSGQWFPAVAGVGVHTLTYTFTNASGCSSSTTIDGRIFSPPAVDAGIDQNVCVNGGLESLNGFSPAGSVFSGPGIVGGNQFDPSVTGLGTFVITASFTDGNGCVNTDTKSISVVNFVDVGFIDASLSFCGDDGTYNLNNNLTGGTPTGGSWSGTGVSGVNFNPGSVSSGTYQMTYSYTNGAGCTDNDVFDVIVTDNPTVSFLQNSFEICSDASPLDLSLASPTPLSGTWLSPYVSGSQFDPSLVPNEGIYQVTYSVSGSCNGSGAISITVNDATIIDAGPNLSYCSNEGPQLITGASVSGGTWFGTGVSGDFFDPGSAGVGSFIISYNYTNNDGCPASDTRTFTVDAPPVVDAGLDITLCSNGTSYSLIGDVNVTGGSFFSNNGGVVGLNFNPSLVSVGIYEVTYNYTDPITTCENSDSRFVTVIDPQVVTVGGDINVCIDGGLYDLTSVPVSILGGSWSGPGVSGSDFNPASAGIGSHDIIYTVDDGDGCESTGNKTLIVEDLPVVDAGSDAFVCSGAPLVALDGTGSPSGGSWSGLYVLGGNFDVSSSGSGTFTVTYTYISPIGCVNFDTKDIIVDAGTTVNAGPDIDVCESDALLDLASRVSPGGGSFVGPGINGNNFDPDVGPGSYTITYTLANEFGCNGSDDILIIVNPDPVVEAGTDATLCFNESPLDLSLTALPAGGVFTGPGIIAGSQFDPTIAGTGNHLVTYVYTNASGCVGIDTRDITVTSLPFISAGNNMFICVSNGLIDLDDNASPNNGTWVGAGVSNGIFDPSIAGVGQHVVTYTIIQGNGCTATDSRVIQIFPDLVVDVGSDILTCTNGGVLNLNANVNVAGGNWDGTGVIGDTFNPASAGAGAFPLVYEVTDQYGCEGTDVLTITVTAPQTVNMGSDLTICVTAPTIDLSSSVSPGGGTFSGSGVSVNNFIPLLAGIGNHDISYTVVDANGCIASNLRRITVTAPPIIDAGDNKVVCLNSNQIDLDEDASIAGGVWAGNGVLGSFFDPSLAGVGSHVINYQLDDGNGCISTDNLTITVRDNITVDAGIDLSFCVNGNSYDLSGDPNRLGGIWNGPGITADSFDPLVAGVGTHLLTYSFTDGFGCVATDTKQVTVNDETLVDAGPALTVCNSSPIIDLTIAASPAGGSWLGAGISGNAFNPGAVGNGSFDLTYSYTDGNGCTTIDIREIIVEEPEVIDVGENLVVCLSSAIIDLDLDNSRIGGIWTGSGVINGKFNPNLSGIGSHELVYVYDDGFGCISTANKRIEVRDDIAVDAGSDLMTCANAGVIDLSNEADLIGGDWSGFGVSGEIFDPGVSGVGVFTLTYRYTDGFSCVAFDTKNITVTPIPNVDAGPNRDICVTADPIVLNLSSSPAGGTWSGSGINAGVFDPSSVGLGSYDLIYTYINGSGCQRSDTRTITVIEPDQVDAGVNRIICVSSDAINLDLFVSDIGGIWDGDGIVSNIFEPAVAGVGFHTLVYTYNNGSGCISSDNIIVQVREDITVDAGEDLSFCVSDVEIDLSNDPSRLGGTWTGSGMNGDRFDPFIAGTGSHVVTYFFTDEFACETFDTRVFNVFDDPFVDAGPDVEICTSNGLLDLSPLELPSGGNWTGQGVVGNFFDASLVGTGDFSLTYEFTNGSGCSGQATKIITVNDPPSIDAGPTEIVCLSGSSIDLDLDVSVQGGFWSGAGVSGGFFTPASAGVGAHILTYTVDDGIGCVSVDSRSIQVRNDITVDAGSDLSFCIGDNTYDLTNDPDRIGGAWEGPGVSGRNFNPLSAGVGSHILTYTFSDDVGCEAVDTRQFIVSGLPTVEAGPPAVVCTTNGLLNLNSSVFPTGGNWSGPGVSGSQFDPSQVGSGVYELTYSITDFNGCSNNDIREVTVNTPPSIDAGDPLIVCLSSPFVDLDLDVSNTGGFWTGVGINGSFFEPSTAGIGTFVLSYALDFGSGCNSLDTRTIQVREDISVDAGIDRVFCIDANIYDLTNDPDKLGGDWDGPGVSGRNFNPSNAGVGTHILTYVFSDAVSCQAIDTRTFTVNALPTVDAGPPASVCTTNGLVDLTTSAFPIGGSWSGPGVNGSDFNPLQVGAGSYDLVYSITDGTGCENSDTREITVTNPATIDAGATEIVCISSSSLDLDLDVSPPGGVWTGIGVSGSFFEPITAGIGTHILTYTYDFGSGCVSTDSKTIQVRADIAVDAGADLSFCIADNTYDLTNDPDKLGGDWDGPGVSGRNFNPSNAGVGVHVLTYLFSDAVGCEATDTRTFTVNALPTIDAGPPVEVCTTNGVLDLTTSVFPAGGFWSGPGVTGSTFNPLQVGSGNYDLVYSITDGTGCANTDIREVRVSDPPSVDAGATEILCISSASIDLDLDVNPPGGNWSGIGISGSFFEPLTAGLGTHQLTYTYNFGGGCIGSDIKVIQVREDITVDAGANINLCVNGNFYDLTNDPDKLGGIWSGAGVLENFFNPSVAGIGAHTLTYDYNDAVGCLASDTRVITVNALPNIDAGPDAFTCRTANPVDLSLSSFPTGGSWSGPGVIGSEFFPVQVGTGDFVVTYNFTDTNGCLVSDTKTVFVNEPTPVDAGANLTICSNSESIDLDLDVSIQGGVWTGLGLEGSFFNPSLVAEGVYTLTYTLDDGNGCISTDLRNINVRSDLNVSLGVPIISCVNESLIDLNNLPSITGGTWSGPGVSSTNFLDPSLAGTGSHVLTYQVQNEFGCMATQTLSVSVLALTAVSAGADFSLCFSEDPVDLATDVFPFGGTFVGDGMIGSVFYPEISGSGIHTITYEFLDGNGCLSQDVREITVFALPIVDAGSNFDICVNADPITLNSVLPADGGTWSGRAIVSSIFNPLDAGIGSHELAYLFTDNTGCFNSDTIIVNVLDEPTLTIGDPIQLCITERPIDLSVDASIQGGSFIGTGVTGRLFNPSAAGVGTFIISYEISFNGCSIIAFRDIQVNDVSTVNIGEDKLLCIDSEPMYLLGDVDQVGGTFSGIGVDGDQFDPVVAGLGSHIITYTYVNAFSCESRDTRILTVQDELDIDAGPDQSLCASVATFDLTPFGRPTGGIYIGSGVTENIFDPSSTGTGDFTISYVLESENGCVSLDELVISVSPSDITDFGADTIICITSSPIDLNFNSELAPGSWNGQGVVNNEFFPSLGGLGTYILSYQNSTLECDIVGRRTITVVGLPQAASSSQTSLAACIGEFLQLEATVSEEDRADNVDVHWFREDETEPFSVGEIINFEVIGDERIYFESVNAFGCGSGQTSFVSISKNNPEGEISVSKQDPDFAEAIQFFAENIENAISYRWDFGDGTWSDERNPFKYYYDSGSFNVSLTLGSNVGCKSTITEVGLVTVGEEPGREDGGLILSAGQSLAKNPNEIVNRILVVRPNPVKDIVTVELMANFSDYCSVEAIYLTGNSLKLSPVFIQRGVNELIIDVSILKAGLYPIVIKGAEGIYKFNIVKVD